jgi:hypothetical protein
MQLRPTPDADELAEIIKEAGKRGHIVILPNPEQLAEQRRAEAAPPSRTEVLVTACRTAFGLSRSEARAFVPLLEHAYATTRDLHRAIAREENPTTTIKIVNVVLAAVRKKIAPIKIENIHGVGFKLAANARDRIAKKLAKYGADIPTSEGNSQSEAAEGGS